MRAATGRFAGELHHLRARASCEFASLKRWAASRNEQELSVTQRFGKSIIVQSVTDRDDHAARLRDRAARLFAVALRAREDGNDQYAEELTLLASEAIDQATDLESRAPQATRAMPHVAPQTQQPQSAHGRRKSRIKK
jgi:hypothetical protein